MKGKVVADAFRTVEPTALMMDEELQQHTGNIGTIKKPSIQAIYNGLNKHYFSLVINYCKNENEQKMLMNLYKKKWNHGLKNQKCSEINKDNKTSL